MKKLMLLTTLSFCVLSLNAANQLNSNKHNLTKQTNNTRTSQVKEKEPKGCKAFGNAIRNIRTVKELQRALNNFSEQKIKECIGEFRNDRRIMHLFEELEKLNKKK